MGSGTLHNGRRIGDVAHAAGVTVRTLHYYEEIGLLVPERTGAGHRLYRDHDVDRLYRISLLRSLGLSLADIGQALDDPHWDLTTAIGAHVRELDRRAEVISRLRLRLLHLIRSDTVKGSVSDELLGVIDDMSKLETHAQQRISILVYRDIEAAFHYLIDVFGLGPGELMRDEQGSVVHGELEAGDGMLWLHLESEPFKLASPSSAGVATGMMAVMVDDVDAHHARAVAKGADVIYEPVDQPYGYREYGARDCEGALWSFMKKLD